MELAGTEGRLRLQGLLVRLGGLRPRQKRSSKPSHEALRQSYLKGRQLEMGWDMLKGVVNLRLGQERIAIKLTSVGSVGHVSASNRESN